METGSKKKRHPRKIRQAEIKSLERLADWMDARFTIPGTNIKYGIDPVLGLLPFIGDTISLTISVYIIMKARQYKLPWYKKWRMYWNAFIDWSVGSIPLFGNIFDVHFKANRRNVRILIDHMSKAEKQD